MAGDYGFLSDTVVIPVKMYYIFGYKVNEVALRHFIAAYTLTKEDERTTVKDTITAVGFKSALAVRGIIKEKFEGEFVAGENFDKFVEEVEAL